MPRSLIVLTVFIALAQAYTTFQTNCTIPTTTVNFVTSNNARGTIDILWSCLFTIIACTWTIQHLNVPEQREERDPGFFGDIKWALKRTWTSAKWMLSTVIAPEVLMSKNLGDLMDVRVDIGRFRELAEEDTVPWSTTHSLFANMGGFVIRSHVPERFGGLADAKVGPDTSELDHESGRVPDLAESEGMDQPEPESNARHQLSSSGKDISKIESGSSHFNPYHLLACDILALRQANLLPRLPYITKSELNDKSKSDSFVRFIAIIQILWIVIQIIVRATRHLAVSQLEIAVIAFSFCAIIIYGLNWEKPKDARVPYTILQYRGEIPKAVLNQIGKGKKESEAIMFMILEFMKRVFPFNLLTGLEDSLPGSPIPNHFVLEKDNLGQLFGFLLGGTVFGSIHIAAWNFTFPTLIERTLWRAASILCATIPSAFFGFLLLMVTLHFRWSKMWAKILWILVFVLYTAARLFLIMETFRTLCFLPPSTYIATWAVNAPHVA